VDAAPSCVSTKADATLRAATAVVHDGRAKVDVLLAKDRGRPAMHRDRRVTRADRAHPEITGIERDLGRVRDRREKRVDRGDLRRDVQRKE
jgi:hypothetical protein